VVWAAPLFSGRSEGFGFSPCLRHRLSESRRRSRQEEVDATIAALKPPKRQRPLIAIIGVNDATEATDYLMPYGILRRADVADVVALATEPGPVTLFPTLKVEPQATAAEFDARHPEGADYVIVPAMSRDDDPADLQWIKSHAAKDAIIIGVCAGAKVVGATGVARRQAGDDPLVLSEGAARRASHDPLCRGPTAGG
jgi:putative intracellular protease/amidase